MPEFRSGQDYKKQKVRHERERAAKIKRKFFEKILPRAAKEGLLTEDARASSSSRPADNAQEAGHKRRREERIQPAQVAEAPKQRVKVWQGGQAPKGSGFTSKGQPVMAHRLFRLVGQLERSINGPRAPAATGASASGSGSGRPSTGESSGHGGQPKVYRPRHAEEEDDDDVEDEEASRPAKRPALMHRPHGGAGGRGPARDNSDDEDDEDGAVEADDGSDQGQADRHHGHHHHGHSHGHHHHQHGRDEDRGHRGGRGRGGFVPRGGSSGPHRGGFRPRHDGPSGKPWSGGGGGHGGRGRGGPRGGGRGHFHGSGRDGGAGRGRGAPKYARSTGWRSWEG